jgi:hypothetical protein
MIRLIVTKFWPALIPILIYIILKIWLKYDNRLLASKLPTITTALIIALLCLVWIFMEKDGYQQGVYQPAHFNEQGELVPAKIKQVD